MFDELGRLGFIEGQNLTVDWREYALQIDVVSEFAAELVKGHVDLIYAVGDVGTRAAQRATTTISIFGIADDMVGSGLVNSLARPGGNTTGVSILAPELNGKRQEILIEAVPGLRRMAALADSNMSSSSKLQELQDAARARNIELSIHWIARPEEIPAVVDAVKTSGGSVRRTVKLTASGMQPSNYMLDNFVAHKLSLLTECGACELSTNANWIGAFVLTSVFRAQLPPKKRAYVFNFLRRAEGSFSAYREARTALIEYIQTPRNVLSPYVGALLNFEVCIGQCYQGYAGNRLRPEVLSEE